MRDGQNVGYSTKPADVRLHGSCRETALSKKGLAKAGYSIERKPDLTAYFTRFGVRKEPLRSVSRKPPLSGLMLITDSGSREVEIVPFSTSLFDNKNNRDPRLNLPMFSMHVAASCNEVEVRFEQLGMGTENHEVHRTESTKIGKRNGVAETERQNSNHDGKTDNDPKCITGTDQLNEQEQPQYRLLTEPTILFSSKRVEIALSFSTSFDYTRYDFDNLTYDNFRAMISEDIECAEAAEGKENSHVTVQTLFPSLAQEWNPIVNGGDAAPITLFVAPVSFQGRVKVDVSSEEPSINLKLDFEPKKVPFLGNTPGVDAYLVAQGVDDQQVEVDVTIAIDLDLGAERIKSKIRAKLNKFLLNAQQA